MGKALWTQAFPKQMKHSGGSLKPRVKPKRKILFRYTTFKKFSPRKRKPVRQVSLVQAELNRSYKKAKRAWRNDPENQRCVVTGQAPADLHHTRGRRRTLLILSRLWLPVSRKVHIWIETHPKLARLAGLLCPEGQYNSVPTEREIQLHEFRVSTLRYRIEGQTVFEPCPLTTAAERIQVERDMDTLWQSSQWQEILNTNTN